MMKHFFKYSYVFLILLFSLSLFSCATLDPRNVQVELKEEMPTVKDTSFTSTLSELGKMTQIYGTGKMKISSGSIRDDTGTAEPTAGEIPKDVSEILKSSLNSIGGNVVYVYYSPGFIKGQESVGFSNRKRKVVPDVMMTGGITEFDRGLETVGDDVKFDAEVKPSFSKYSVGIDGSDFGKSAISRITLDFNLIDFHTTAGIPKVQTVNTVKVHKAVAEKEIGFTLFGPSFGLKGTVKKVQGRHAAIRLLVELSMIQMTGKYLCIPYWNLLPDAEPDPVVLDAVKNKFYNMKKAERISKIQEFLYIHGYDDIYVTGITDNETIAALKRINSAYDPNKQIDFDTFVKVFTSVPITDNAMIRRKLLATRPKERPLLSLQTGFVYRPGGKGELRDITSGIPLHSGDHYKIVLQSNHDCHIYIFQADSSGQLFQLFPMSSFKGVVVNNANPALKGQSYTIPAENKAFVLDKQVGTEKIYIAASREQNPELENLYTEIKEARTSNDAYYAQNNLRRHLGTKRGVKGIVTNEPMQVAWQETGDIFTVMGLRLEKISKDFIYELEFQHQ